MCSNYRARVLSTVIVCSKAVTRLPSASYGLDGAVFIVLDWKGLLSIVASGILGAWTDPCWGISAVRTVRLNLERAHRLAPTVFVCGRGGFRPTDARRMFSRFSRVDVRFLLQRGGECSRNEGEVVRVRRRAWKEKRRDSLCHSAEWSRRFSSPRSAFYCRVRRQRDFFVVAT